MQYLRTASGSFINAATITLLTPERGEGDAIMGWVATCRDGQTIALAPYFTLPGRIEAVLDRLPADIVALDQNEGALTCPSGNCCAEGRAFAPITVGEPAKAEFVGISIA